MSGEERSITIVGVDKDGIRESADNKGYWVIPFRLSAKPDDSWSRNFYEIHKKTAVDGKCKANVAGDTILVSTPDTGDLQKVLDAMKLEVLSTNEICETHFQKKLQIQQELDILRKNQADMIEKLKGDSDKLQF